MGALRRTAYLLCRDWHTADDLVAITLDKLYRRWGRRHQVGNLDLYVRGMLARAWVDELRRPWRRERLTIDADLTASYADPDPARTQAVIERLTLGDYLSQLGPRQRAVIVLRFYCDLSVAETAEALGISEGTVKSQAARGLHTLRAIASHTYQANSER